ncbi:MAG: methionyl-tRNA formyltransferase [Anaerolineaceae bacterium]
MDTRVVFMGSPDFALPTLEALHKNTRVVGVVTQPDRPAGRGRLPMPSPVKQLADKLGIPVFQPLSLRKPGALEQLAAWQPDLIVVAAFGQILPKSVLALPPKGCINVHASLLPRWRGASPIQAAILAGDERSGVTIMLMEEGLDTGPILTQRTVPIRPGTTGAELSQQLAFLGASTLIDILPTYLSGMLAPLTQADGLATYAPMLKKMDGLLDFNQPALALTRKVHAYYPWPGTYFILNGKHIKVLDAHPHDTFESEIEGRYIVNGMPAIGTSEGLLVLDQVQPEGKRGMPGSDFLNGQPGWLS